MPSYECYACGLQGLSKWAGTMVWIHSEEQSIPLCKRCEGRAWKEHQRDHPQAEWIRDPCLDSKEWHIHERMLWKAFPKTAIAWATRERTF